MRQERLGLRAGRAWRPLTKYTLLSVLLKMRKCVTPRGPATATQSFREFFFRT